MPLKPIEELTFTDDFMFGRIMQNPEICKVSADVKGDMVLMNRYGVKFDKAYFDLGVAAYIIKLIHKLIDFRIIICKGSLRL